MATRRKRKAGPHRKRPEPFAKLIGARIKALRVARSFSFDAWVEETGLGRGHIAEIEKGLVTPSTRSLKKIADALQLSLADLVLIEDTPRARLFDLTAGLSTAAIEKLLRQAKALSAEHAAEPDERK